MIAQAGVGELNADIAENANSPPLIFLCDLSPLFVGTKSATGCIQV